jgi:hypothetical protein
VAWFAAIVCRERCGVERRIAEAEFQIGAEPTRTPESCIRECCRYSGACAPWRSGTSSQVQHVIQDIVYCICCTRNPCLVSDHKSGSETWAKVAADKLDQRSRGCRASRLRDQPSRRKSPGEQARGHYFGETSSYRSCQRRIPSYKQSLVYLCHVTTTCMLLRMW